MLLHHFSSEVSYTLSDRPDYRTSWSLHIPRDGYEHPYLMHNMLAVSALHLSQTSKGGDLFDATYYRELAIYHHNWAVSLLRPHVIDVTIKNFDALYASSMLAFLFNAVLLRSSNSSRLGHNIAALCELARGTLAVRQEGFKRFNIESSHLMREYRPWDYPPPLPDTIHRTIKHIEKLVNSLPETGHASKNKTQYMKSTKLLRMTFNALNLNHDQPAMIFMWLVLIDREYVDLLKSRDTMALLILAHYGICATEVKDKWWALKYGRYIVAAVHRILDHSEEIDLFGEDGS